MTAGSSQPPPTLEALSSEKERVLARCADLEQALLDSLRELVRIPSVAPTYPGEERETWIGGEGSVSAALAAVYRQIGCEVEMIGGPGRENVVGLLRGAGGGKSLALNGHVDVVPPGNDEDWRHPPFSGQLADGRVWGRGSADMKGGLAAQAFAAKAVVESGVRLRGDLILEAVVGEEVMAHEIGASAVLERGYLTDVAVVGEPSACSGGLAVMPATAGLLWFSVSVEGKLAHPALRGETIHPSRRNSSGAVNAIDEAFEVYRALRELEDEWARSRQHELFSPGDFGLLPGIITGGPGALEVPFLLSDRATIEYCCLHSPGDDAVDVRAEIEDQIARLSHRRSWLRAHPPQIEWKLEWPAANVPADHPIVSAVARSHQTAGNGIATTAGFRGVSDATWFLQRGIPAIIYGPGAVSAAHAANENVAVEQVLQACRTYALLILDWCGLASE
jgi:acetylornithine deacetylase/succinyl-diaminopimelate desuccinylase family protein